MATCLGNHRHAQGYNICTFPFVVRQSHLDGHSNVLRRFPSHHHEAQHQLYPSYIALPDVCSDQYYRLDRLSMAPPVYNRVVDDHATSTDGMVRSPQTSFLGSTDNEWQFANSAFGPSRYEAGTATQKYGASSAGSQNDQRSLITATFSQDTPSAFECSLTGHIKENTPGSEHSRHTGTSVSPTDIMLAGDDEIRSSYEPSLPVSPQDVFPYAAAHVVSYARSTLSAQDGGYGSDNDSFDCYKSESPMPSVLDRYTLNTDRPLTLPESYSLAQQGTWLPSQPHIDTVAARNTSDNVNSRGVLPRSEPLFDEPCADSGYAGTDSGDEMHLNRPSGREQREAQNRFLVQARRAGKSYREIRAAGNFREAESTLRGRFRDLTKRKHERVRKPIWTRCDVKLLTEIVDHLLETSPYMDDVRHNDSASVKAALPRVPWKEVSSYIVANGGSYRFASATCKKKYMQLNQMN